MHGTQPREWHNHATRYALAIAFLTAGCSGLPFQGRNGTIHHVIIGFGVVSVNQSNQTAAVVSRMHALGLTLSNQPNFHFGLGYADSAVVTVPDNAKDVRLELSQRPFGPVRLDLQSATLTLTNQPHHKETPP